MFRLGIWWNLGKDIFYSGCFMCRCVQFSWNKTTNSWFFIHSYKCGKNTYDLKIHMIFWYSLLKCDHELFSSSEGCKFTNCHSLGFKEKFCHSAHHALRAYGLGLILSRYDHPQSLTAHNYELSNFEDDHISTFTDRNV